MRILSAFWLDAPLLANPDRYLAEPGGIVESVEDLEEIDPDHWARCDQREMPISRIGKDLGRLPYAKKIGTFNATFSPELTKNLCGEVINVTDDRVYYRSGNALYYFTLNNITVSGPIVNGHGTVNFFVMRENCIIEVSVDTGRLVVTKYSLDGAIIKTIDTGYISTNTVPFVLTKDSRISITLVATSNSVNYSGLAVYSDDDFESYNTFNSVFGPNVIVHNIAVDYLYGYQSIDEPFTTWVAKGSNDIFYIVLAKRDKSAFLIFRSFDGFSWGEYKIIDRRFYGNNYLYGIVNNILHIIYLDTSNSDHQIHIKINLKTDTIEYFDVKDPMKDIPGGSNYIRSLYSGAKQFPEITKQVVYRYGKLYITAKTTDKIIYDLEKSTYEIICFGTGYVNTMEYAPMDNGDLLMVRFDTFDSSALDIYNLERKIDESANRFMCHYYRITKNGLKTYTMFAPNIFANTTKDTSIYGFVYHKTLKILYLMMKRLTGGNSIFELWSIDASKNILPYAPGKYIRLNPPETQ